MLILLLINHSISQTFCFPDSDLIIFVYNSNILFQQYREIVGVFRTAVWCHKYWLETPTYGKVYEIYMLLLILVIPFSVMIITYTWIANIVWHVATRRADMRSGRYKSLYSKHRINGYKIII